jgi:hypothetical protein
MISILATVKEQLIQQLPHSLIRSQHYVFVVKTAGIMSRTLDHSDEVKDLYANIYFHLLGRYVHSNMGQGFVKELRLVGAEEWYAMKPLQGA